MTPVTLREIYHHPGEHSVKLLIDPSESPSIDLVSAELRDADGAPVPVSLKRWGTKLTVGFKTDSATPDGVCVLDLTLRRLRSDWTRRERFSFWTVK